MPLLGWRKKYYKVFPILFEGFPRKVYKRISKNDADEVLSMRIRRDEQIMNDCLSIIESTMVPDTFFMRLDLIIEKLETLTVLEAVFPRRFRTYSPRKLLDFFATNYQELQASFLEQYYAFESSRLMELKTKRGRVNRAKKHVEKADAFSGFLTNESREIMFNLLYELEKLAEKGDTGITIQNTFDLPEQEHLRIEGPKAIAKNNEPIRDEDVPARILHGFMTREPTEYELWYDSLSEEDKEAKYQFFKAPGAEYSALEAELWEAWDQILNSDRFEGTLRACDNCDAAALKLEQYCLSQGYGAVLHFESRWLRMHNSQHPKYSVYDRSDWARQEASENVRIRDRLLGLLADGPQLQKDIPHILGIERPAVMRVLKLLESQGHVSRTKHQRTYEVALRVYDRPNCRE